MDLVDRVRIWQVGLRVEFARKRARDGANEPTLFFRCASRRADRSRLEPWYASKVCRSSVFKKCEVSLSLHYYCVILSSDSEELSEVPRKTRVRKKTTQADCEPGKMNRSYCSAAVGTS